MKLIQTLSALLLCTGVYAQQNNFRLDGNIGHYNSGKVFIAYEVEGHQVIDSATLQNGHFTIKGAIKQPTMAKMYRVANDSMLPSIRYVMQFTYARNTNGSFVSKDIQEGLFRHQFDYRYFYLDKGQLSITGKDSIKTAMIAGPGYNKTLNTEYAVFLTSYIRGMDKVFYALTPEGLQLSKNDPGKFSMIQEQGYKEADSSLHAFVFTHPSSYATLDLMRIYCNWNTAMTKTDEAEKIYNSLSPKLKNTHEGKLDAQRIEMSRLFETGHPAPDFTLSDLNGKNVSLSDFRGKYVLLDFWFRGCHPCREEMPYMKAAYEHYKDKNFVVLAVCVDKPENMRIAIREDHTDDFVQLIDSTFGNSKAVAAYKVNSNGYPSNFLIGPDGKFLAKDLHKGAYEEKLAAIFK